MSPNEPLDDAHRISLILTARIREWWEAMRVQVDAWQPRPYPNNKEKNHE